MKNHLPDFVKKRFKVSLDDLPEFEHRVVQHLGERRHIKPSHGDVCAMPHTAILFSKLIDWCLL
jgi:hypothetical protein